MFFRWDAEIELTKKAIAAANKLRPKPKFFIVCGDLVDGLPGSHISHIFAILIGFNLITIHCKERLRTVIHVYRFYVYIF